MLDSNKCTSDFDWRLLRSLGALITKIIRQLYVLSFNIM
jgi:hypothetical protein